MPQSSVIEGFSKFSKQDKVQWIADQYFQSSKDKAEEIQKYWLTDHEKQTIMDGFSENVIGNHILPFSVAPNFLIDGVLHTLPMVIEESSVVAAASSAAKFWLTRGGFKTTIISTTKLGHVHFTWSGNILLLQENQTFIIDHLMEEVAPLVSNMQKRGGGVKEIVFKDLSKKVDSVFQIEVSFETCDSMGANFINTVLEAFAAAFTNLSNSTDLFPADHRDVEVVMSILSNYTPECLVHVETACPVDQLGGPINDTDAITLAHKFKKAVDIARADTYRAVTHNKGIFNGIDALILATGNDFRAVEACGHAFAAKSGQYISLSSCEIEDGIFQFSMDIPLALGTVGGLTSLHPMAKIALEILGNPSACDLMRYTAALGLAQNFAAVKSLVTTGIQKGHMRMHLQNIINHLGLSITDADLVNTHFRDKAISHSAIRTFVEENGKKQDPNLSN